MNNDDNSFNNQGIMNEEPEQMDDQNFPRSGGNSLAQFGQGAIQGFKNGVSDKLMKGVPKNNKNSPEKGQKKPEKGKKDGLDKKDQPEKKKDNNDKKNPLPGAQNKKNADPRKKDGSNVPNNKNSSIKDKFGGLTSRLNPFSKKKNDDKNGNSSKKGTGVKEKATGAIKTGIKKLWTILPIQAKIAIIIIVPMIILLLFLFNILFAALAGAVVPALCGALSYNIGSTDATSFLKNMSDPMGNVSYAVTSLYGWRNCDFHGSEFHAAVDLAGPNGTPIYAVSDGTISKIGINEGFGNSITINHNDTFYTMYNHLSSFKSNLSVGSSVKQGDVIGYEGNTGDSTGAHLDFRLFDKDNKPISINAYFGYSDKGYESCVDPDANASASKCSFESSGSARKLGSDGFIEIVNKTNDYTNSDCCSSYSSSVNTEDVSGLPKILTNEFINGAVQSQSKYGVPASLTLAQLILESSGEYEGGVSGLAYNCKNLFGIKGKGTAGACFYNTGEQTSSGASYDVVAGFRKYNSYAESIEDHAALLVSDWYARCTKNAKTADDWAREIKNCGYATDVNYADKVINIMKTYNLYKYDDSSVFGSGNNTCDTGQSGDIADKANEEYEKWNKASASERNNTPKSYMEACSGKKVCNEWCAGFVSYILKETGKLSNLKNYSCLADSYTKVEPATHHKQGSGYTPRAGDIIVFDYAGNGSGSHVAIVESVEGQTIHYIGGNQTGTNSANCWSNAITKVTVPLDSSSILEFVTIG